MQTKYDYDVLYIGSGHAVDGVIALAKKGLKVAVVEGDRYGGTCPNWGCNAKIALDEPIKLTKEQKRMKEIVNGNLSINWSQNMKHKHELIDGFSGKQKNEKQAAGIDTIDGWATFVDPHTISVNNKKYSSDKIVIATGQHPNIINLPGNEYAHDSRDFLALDELPKSIAIIGAGYIALEFATIASEAGAKVTILMHRDKVLRQFYQPYVLSVVDELKHDGVSFIKNANVASYSQNDSGYQVHYGNRKILNVDWILDAAGRVPNIKNLNLGKAGVDYDRKGIKVNDHLQSSQANIYASGDVADTGEPKLTPAATFESKYLTKLLSGQKKDAIQFPPIPSTVFTSPRIAQVGVTVDQAKQNPEKYIIKSKNIKDDWYRQVDKEEIAKYTLIFNRQDQLVGAAEVSDHAEDVIDYLYPAIALKLDREKIEYLEPFIFPSIAHDAWKRL
ncbi:glutathione reductase [Philodulcilactobacillus myokoensis]|uniref:Glutathione reductase n=1 Tax=Philodulcilactobacillus myokoensis TaxID=2929573 RepID=A0A9W6ESK8_9LACO|nr:NAD(P)/FAD-dependent oxidoreductase [Philodulcilactobacillus myokoensis]GLB46433.1 glutathione reductase [Philodulcilactobacillus myokoensis]